MNGVSWADSLIALASSGQFLVAIIGFRLIYKQIKHLNMVLKNDAQGHLYTQNAEVRTLIASYPEIRKYFFENCVIDHNDENYARVRTIAEMYANYLEHLSIQEPNLDSKDWGMWSMIVRDIYASSPIIREVIEAKPHWYANALRHAIGHPQTN